MEISKEDWKLFSALIHAQLDRLEISDPAILTSSEDNLRVALSQYLNLLIEKNKQINLTAIESFEAGVWKHLYDSLLLIHFEPFGSVLDWGSGGGTPGIPLSLFRKFVSEDSSGVVCLDSVAKKIKCVAEFAEVLDIPQFDTSSLRGEDFLRTNSIDTVVMRAVAPPERSFNWVSPRAHNWIFMTGPRGRTEWDAYIPRMKSKGFHLVKDAVYELPHNHGSRHVLHFAKK